MKLSHESEQDNTDYQVLYACIIKLNAEPEMSVLWSRPVKAAPALVKNWVKKMHILN